MLYMWNPPFTREIHIKLCRRMESDGGGRIVEKKWQKTEKDRKKESRVLWSETACQRLPCRHCALMILHTSETNSEDDDHRFICCLWPHYCHSPLGQQLGSGEGERKKRKTEPKRTFWSMIYNLFPKQCLYLTSSKEHG